MKENFLYDENKFYKFDFTSAVSATSLLTKKYELIDFVLNSVDFLVETKDEILLVEYKYSIDGKVNNDNIKSKEHYFKIAKKFYDSLLYVYSCKKLYKINYIYILEGKNLDSVIRNYLRNKIKKILPYELQKDLEIKVQMINDFKIISIKDWNKIYNFEASELLE